jgi:protein-S-isoprenylcysteine O-methyltransferase Ste14
MLISWTQWLAAGLLFCCLGSFAWAVRGFFTQPAGFTAAMKLISACSAAFGVLHLFAIFLTSRMTTERIVSGSLVYVSALLLFWWALRTALRRPLSAAFSPDIPAHLVVHGPYRFVRHPFYCSYMLTWFAGWIVTGVWWLLPTAAVMLAIYLVASAQEEGKFLHSPLGDAYLKYRSQTGRFLPNPWKVVINRQKGHWHRDEERMVV